MSFRYTVAGHTLPLVGYDLHENTEQIFRVIKDAGYDGVDVTWEPERTSAKELRRIADSTGLKIVQLLPAWAGEGKDFACTDEETRRKGIEYAKRGIDFAVVVGAPLLQYCLPQPAQCQLPFPKDSIRVLRDNLAASLSEVCEYASQRDITVAIEPLNCYESYHRVVDAVHLAINLVRDLGFSNLGLQPDVFHMNISDASIADSLRAAGDFIKHVHVNETDHYPLGNGHADLRSLVRTLREINYTGYLAIYMPFTTPEVFKAAFSGGDKSARPDLKTYLEWPLKIMKRIEKMIDLQWQIFEIGQPYLAV